MRIILFLFRCVCLSNYVQFMCIIFLRAFAVGISLFWLLVNKWLWSMTTYNCRLHRRQHRLWSLRVISVKGYYFFLFLPSLSLDRARSIQWKESTMLSNTEFLILQSKMNCMNDHDFSNFRFDSIRSKVLTMKQVPECIAKRSKNFRNETRYFSLFFASGCCVESDDSSALCEEIVLQLFCFRPHFGCALSINGRSYFYYCCHFDSVGSNTHTYHRIHVKL